MAKTNRRQRTYGSVTEVRRVFLPKADREEWWVAKPDADTIATELARMSFERVAKGSPKQAG